MSGDYHAFFDGNRRARKPYKCDSCGFSIQIGDTYARRSYTWEGFMIEEQLHTWCRAELQLFFDETHEDSFDWYEVQEFIEEMIRWYGHFPRGYEED